VYFADSEVAPSYQVENFTASHPVASPEYPQLDARPNHSAPLRNDKPIRDVAAVGVELHDGWSI
jgi:hypothetical protein